MAIVAAVLVCGLAVSTAAWACPTCKDAVDTADAEGLNMARGYFYSILLMLAMPATLIGSFGVYVWREMQRQQRDGVSAIVVADPEANGGPRMPPPLGAATPTGPRS
ncbi:MAG: hypothetical protein EBX36_01410 [Planctomycetia bacterium]|nr:hypothetical protein [Planctomycetia bacterium]